MLDSKNTIGKLISELTDLITPISPDIAQSEAITILETLLGKNRSYLFLHSQDEISQSHYQKALSIGLKRKEGIPLAYALGSQYFYNKEFLVSADTLIPRPDTETLIIQILENENHQEPYKLLELGTGTGIIPEVLTTEAPAWSAISVDISFPTLAVARKNCNKKIQLLNSNSFSALKANNQFDILVSNPPYISTSDVQQLEKCVTDFEPLHALDGGDDGLDFYRYLATTGKGYLKPKGRIYLEIGFDQGESVPALLKGNEWEEVKLYYDLGRRPRVVSAIKF